MPRIPNTRPTSIYWLYDIRPETLIEWPDGRPFYCGKTVATPDQRFVAHRAATKRFPEKLISAWLRACGPNVHIRTMEIVSSEEDWRTRERYWICTIRALYPGGANISDGGDGVPGFAHSISARAKISKASKERKRVPFSKETRAKMSLAHSGKKLGRQSSDHRARIGLAIKTQGKERGAKISAALKGKAKSDSHRASMAAVRRGKKRGPLSAETRAKIGAAKRAVHEAKRIASTSVGT